MEFPIERGSSLHTSVPWQYTWKECYYFWCNMEEIADYLVKSGRPVIAYHIHLRKFVAVYLVVFNNDCFYHYFVQVLDGEKI